MRQTVYLAHHGVKGQKWGVRRYQNKDGTLTAAGKRRYALKGYSQDAYNSNRTVIGKAYDLYTGAHKYAGDYKYANASQKERDARAERYVADRDRQKREKEIKKNAIKGYSQDAYDSNKTILGKGYDKYTGAHKIAGKFMYEAATPKEREARAEKYVNVDKKKKQEAQLQAAGYALGTVLFYLVDQKISAKKARTTVGRGMRYCGSNTNDSVSQLGSSYTLAIEGQVQKYIKELEG